MSDADRRVINSGAYRERASFRQKKLMPYRVKFGRHGDWSFEKWLREMTMWRIRTREMQPKTPPTPPKKLRPV